jgi:drug/metabolite transporter (DMT)-like permease
MLLAAFILKEPITGKKVLGIACGAGGALLLILGSSQNQPAASSASHTAIWGDLLVLFAQFCYAFYIVRFRDFVNKYSLITIMKWMFTYSFICTIPFSASDLMNADWSGLKAVEIGSLTFIVVGATFVSYMLIVLESFFLFLQIIELSVDRLLFLLNTSFLSGNFDPSLFKLFFRFLA